MDLLFVFLLTFIFTWIGIKVCDPHLFVTFIGNWILPPWLSPVAFKFHIIIIIRNQTFHPSIILRYLYFTLFILFLTIRHHQVWSVRRHSMLSSQSFSQLEVIFFIIYFSLLLPCCLFNFYLFFVLSNQEQDVIWKRYSSSFHCYFLSACLNFIHFVWVLCFFTKSGAGLVFTGCNSIPIKKQWLSKKYFVLLWNFHFVCLKNCFRIYIFIKGACFHPF